MLLMGVALTKHVMIYCQGNPVLAIQFTVFTSCAILTRRSSSCSYECGFYSPRLRRSLILQSTDVCEVLERAAPVFPVVKTDGLIRLCGDYKVTINQAAQKDTYPLTKRICLLPCQEENSSPTLN